MIPRRVLVWLYCGHPKLVMTVFGFSSGLLFALVASTLFYDPASGAGPCGTMRGDATVVEVAGCTAAALGSVHVGAFFVVQVVGTLFFGDALRLEERVAQELAGER